MRALQNKSLESCLGDVVLGLLLSSFQVHLGDAQLCVSIGQLLLHLAHAVLLSLELLHQHGDARVFVAQLKTLTQKIYRYMYKLKRTCIKNSKQRLTLLYHLKNEQKPYQ